MSVKYERIPRPVLASMLRLWERSSSPFLTSALGDETNAQHTPRSINLPF